MPKKLFLKWMLLVWCCIVPVILRAQPLQTLKQRVLLIRNAQYTIGSNAKGSRDSVVFRYSGKRGSTFAPHFFHAWHDAGYKNYINPAGSRPTDLPEPFDDISSLYVLYDTCYEFGLDNNGAISQTNIAYLSLKYDEQDLVIGFDHHYRSFSIDKPRRDLIIRDAAGNPVKIIFLSIDTATGAIDTIGVKSVLYGADGHVSTDTADYRRSSSLDIAHEYSHNSQGKINRILEMIKMPGQDWQFNTSETFSYNQKGLPETYLLERSSSGAPIWLPETSMEFDHDNIGRLTHVRDFYHWPVFAPRLMHSIYIHYNTAGLADSFIEYHSSRVLDRTAFFYNEFRNPDSAITYRSDDSGKTFKSYTITKYDYELYYDTIMSAPKGNIVLYPNPANSKLTIRWNTKKPGGSVYAVLYSSTGQRVKNIHIANIAPENIINISGISSGIYYLQIITEGGGKLHTEAIVINNNGS